MRSILFVLLAPAFAFAAPTLPTFHVDSQAISISGVSSGAFMAVQMQVAFSTTIMGSASVAGGTYWCAKGDLKRAQSVCQLSPEKIRTPENIATARDLAYEGLIDPPAALAGHQAYVFASPRDTIVNSGNSDKLVQFLKAFSMNVTYVKSVPAAHGFPTLNNGGPCAFPGMPWILNCGYDTAGEILKTMYGTLKPRGEAVASHLRTFSQADFGDSQTPLHPEGWVYVPAACESGELCKLHVALHGCQMNPEFIQDQFVRLAGYNEWAETNNVIVLYPQSAKFGQANPFACWDWYGFTGKDYVNQNGPQMAALKKMIDRVRGY